MFPTLQHQSRFTWDFWYYFDLKEKQFHIFYLNADPKLVHDEQHHFHSQVGYATTKDFTIIEWGSDNVLTSSPNRWDNSSIWTGDVIKINDGFLLFYTSRNLETDDGKTQNIGVAFADRINASKWEPIQDFRLRPDGNIYLSKGIKEDVTIHAWRDPFLFCYNNECYMLVTAKTSANPVGRNGVVALLHSKNGGFKDWEYLYPASNPGCYSEMEVSQILINDNGNFELAFSTGPKYDNTPLTKGQGGLYTMVSENPLSFQKAPVMLNAFQNGLYACRIIPELGNAIVGFDLKTGGLRRCDIKNTYQPVNKYFSDWKI
ncbi:MAG: glycoside hydrolase family 68 protein [Candidatus Marinimicrobia bacterium]|nr:glycoside hydrolase family 68 protein [Candidatus Neomarinimicrobiota bacterium]